MTSPWWKGMRASEISAEIYAAARALFPAPEWVTMEEIAIPGTQGARRADLVALSIWGPTRAVVAEIKATRADFLNEIRDPSKRQPGMRFGTEFAFILPSGLVQADEIPEGCGLYEVQRNRRVRRVRVGEQRTNPGWTPAMFHQFVRAMVYRKNPTYRVFQEAGNEGSKIYRGIFRALGQEWTLDELIDLTKTLYRGLYYRKQDAELAHLDYRERLRRDPEIVRLYELEKAVQRACGYSQNTAERFTEWYANQSARGTPDADRDLNDVQAAHRSLGRILDRYEQRKRAAVAQDEGSTR